MSLTLKYAGCHWVMAKPGELDTITLFFIGSPIVGSTNPSGDPDVIKNPLAGKSLKVDPDDFNPKHETSGICYPNISPVFSDSSGDLFYIPNPPESDSKEATSCSVYEEETPDTKYPILETSSTGFAACYMCSKKTDRVYTRAPGDSTPCCLRCFVDLGPQR